MVAFNLRTVSLLLRSQKKRTCLCNKWAQPEYFLQQWITSFDFIGPPLLGPKNMSPFIQNHRFAFRAQN